MPNTFTPNAQHGRFTRVIVEAADLSCQIREASINLSLDTTEATPFCVSLKQYVAGLPDGKISLNGFQDLRYGAGNSLARRRFARGQKVRLAVCHEGHAQGGFAEGAEGFITSFQEGIQAADVMSLSMEVQLTGEVYVMRNAWDYSITALTTASAFTEVQLSASLLPAPYNQANNAGLVYYQMFVDGGTPWATQTVTFTGTPTAGTFTLTYLGQTTSALAFNVAAAAVQTAMQALSTVGTGNCTVAGGPAPGTPLTFTFSGSAVPKILAYGTTGLMSANPAALTPTTTIAVTATNGLNRTVAFTNGNTTAPATNIGNVTVPADGTPVAGVIGTYTSPKILADFLRATVATLAAGEVLYIYCGLADPRESLLNA